MGRAIVDIIMLSVRFWNLGTRPLSVGGKQITSDTFYLENYYYLYNARRTDMIHLAFFAPGHGIYWLIGVLLVIVIYRWKAILLGLLNLLLIPLMFPIALVSAIFNWEPKFVKRWEKEIEEAKKKKA